VPHIGSARRENLSIPAFVRDGKPIEREINVPEPRNVVKVGLIDDTSNADLEIPTYLRRQAD
jgi:hypothetical protein